MPLLSKRWIEIYQPRPQASLRLFCVPCAGGAAQMFKSWASHLPHLVEVCSLQLPGRWSRLREPMFTRVPDLIEAVVPALLSYLDKPFAIMGHSLGGLVAFEITRALRRQGLPGPHQLFISAHRAAHLPHLREAIYTLPDQAFIDRLVHSYQGIPREVLAEPELLELLLPALRADIEMFETYRYLAEPPLSCSLAVYGGQQDPVVTQPQLAPWAEHTTAEFSLELLAGGHFFISTAQQEFLARIRARLEAIVKNLP